MSPTSPSPRPAARVAFVLAGDLAMYALTWTGIVAGLYAFNMVINTTIGESRDSSLWDVGVLVVRYALLAGGIVVARSYVPVFVVHGITRRDSYTGGVPVALGLAVLVALGATLVFWFESIGYEAAGWPHDMAGRDAYRIYDALDQYGLVLVELLAVSVAHIVSGLLIGSAMERWGDAGGLFIPVAVLPAAITEMVLGAGIVGMWLVDLTGIESPAPGVAVAISAVVVAAGVAGIRLLTRDAPVDGQHLTWWR
jgi:hypothetical protein